MANNQQPFNGYNNNNNVTVSRRQSNASTDNDISAILNGVLANKAGSVSAPAPAAAVSTVDDDEYPADAPNSIFAIWYWAFHSEFRTVHDYMNLLLVYVLFIMVVALIVAIVFSVFTYMGQG